jgi:hypothetical protein
LDITTLVIAVLGLAVAVAGIGWQIAAHTLSGAVVRVEICLGALGAGGAVIGKPGDADVDFAQLRAQGYDTPVVVVQIRNVGRLAVDVTHWCIATHKLTYTPVADLAAVNPRLPYRLDAGASVNCFVQLGSALALVDSAVSVLKMAGRDVRGSVTLATGKDVQSRAMTIPHAG